MLDFLERATEAYRNYSSLRNFMTSSDCMEELNLQTQYLPNNSPIKQRLWHIIYGKGIQTCECGNKVKWNTKNNTYRTFCSPKCSRNNELVKSKTQDTCLSRFGKKTNLITEDAKNNYKTKMMIKFGVENPFMSLDVQSSIRDNAEKKHGVRSYSQLQETKDKITETHRKKYGRDRFSQIHMSEEICELKKNRDYLSELYSSGICIADIATKLNVGYSQLCIKFNDLGIEIRESSGQYELYNFLKEIYSGEIILNAKNLFKDKKEIDIYLPELHIGIEYDGVYWHSELSNKKKNYHIDKDREAKEVGIKLYHITDIEWKTMKDICKSRVSSFVGANDRIYARKTTIVEVSSSEAANFFKANHIQGNFGATAYIGLQYNGELSALMSIGKSRFNDHQYELIRYCSKLNTNVVGGASKIFKYAIAKLNIDNIVSFCDLRWGTGKLYQQLGFTHKKDSGPSYMYTNRYHTLENRQRYQKSKLKNTLKKFDENLSGWENMQLNGYDRYWTSGNAMYVRNKQP